MTQILIRCPALPGSVVESYVFSVSKKTRLDSVPEDPDERYDGAYDLVTGLDDDVVPWDEASDDINVDCAREWAYELLRRVGHPYPGAETLSPDVAFDPPRPESARDESEALAAVNLHRRALGVSPLDPEAAGWMEKDVVAEWQRIQRLPNLGLI